MFLLIVHLHWVCSVLGFKEQSINLSVPDHVMIFPISTLSAPKYLTSIPFNFQSTKCSVQSAMSITLSLSSLSLDLCSLALKFWGYWWCFPVEVPAGFIWRQRSVWTLITVTDLLSLYLSLFFALVSSFPFYTPLLFFLSHLLLLLSPPTPPLLFNFILLLSALLFQYSSPVISPFFPVSLSGLPVFRLFYISC